MGALMTTLQEKRRSVTMAGAGIFYPNVPDHLSPLASGIRACSAGEMPEVPEAWGLGESVC